ncbi:hypothetical protein SAZ_13090 [Streptomyces noursei ZPM]|nr:hypothetical protein SAZ_13090 [Streptomyces noursei ZPM]
MAAARRAVSTRATRPAPRPPEGTPPPAELARQARAVLAGPARLARWADRTGSLRAGPDGSLPDAAVADAADALGLTPRHVRADWDRARLAGLVELHDGLARPGWRLRAWDRDDVAALRGWVALFDAWSLAVPPPRRSWACGAAPSGPSRRAPTTSPNAPVGHRRAPPRRPAAAAGGPSPAPLCPGSQSRSELRQRRKRLAPAR